MNLTGIITEYNPLHCGHILHLNKSKEITNSDGIVCVMSGNFVQRGLPALTDKWTRTAMALEAGVDLVLELPTLFSLSSAEYFAFGAVSTLDSLNIINNLCFGSEEGDINLIKEVAKILNEEPNEFKDILKSEISLGIPFPKARAKALSIFLSKYNNLSMNNTKLMDFLNNSNNILGIEYCKSLLKLNSSIKAFTIKREGADYNNEAIIQSKFQSATAIRKSIFEGHLENTKEFLPEFSYNILKSKNNFANAEEIFKYIKYKILSNQLILKNIPEATEGLDNKILKELQKSNSFEELITNCKSKRYTYTRISRILSYIYLEITNNLNTLRKERPNYIRVLGLSEKGSKILKEIKKNSDIKIITKVPRKIDDELLELDIKATNLYSLLNPTLKLNSDYLISPVIYK